MFDHLLIIRYNQTIQTKLQTYKNTYQTKTKNHVNSRWNRKIKTNKQTKQSTKRFYQKYLELRRRINAHSYPVLPATLNTGIIGVNSTYTIAPTTSTATTTNNFTVQRSASLKDYKPLRYEYAQFGIHDISTSAKLHFICLSFNSLFSILFVFHF